MLFRPEEVVLASSAAPVDHGVFRRHHRYFPLISLQVDAFGAMGAGVFQLDVVFPVLAVDQQQKVDRSRDAELDFVVQGHGMEREPQTFEKSAVVCCQRVASHELVFGECQESKQG